MSFFCRKKYIDSPWFLWSFGFLLAMSCVCFHQIELRQNKSINEYVTFHYELKEEDSTKAVIARDDNLNSLYAKYALLMDATNRRVLFEKNAYDKVPMASTTKIMTLIVTLENANLEDLVTVSKYAASMPDVQLNMKEGEQYKLKDLLYSLMLESHNDTAVAIAEHVGGTVEGFASMMNRKAYEIGAYNTHFVTPNGLDNDEHYTTAYDLALIASYGIENQAFVEIIKTLDYTFHEQTTGRCFTVHNKDRFLTTYKDAIGIKTGFTGNAGYCFVGAMRSDEKCFVSVVLACGWPPNKNYKWKDTTRLMNYGNQNYQLKEILHEGTAFQLIPVLDSVENAPITPYTKDNISLLLSSGDSVHFDVELPKQLVAPIKKDDTIGKVTIKIQDSVYKVLPIYAKESRNKITYGYIFKKILFQYLYFC